MPRAPLEIQLVSSTQKANKPRKSGKSDQNVNTRGAADVQIIGVAQDAKAKSARFVLPVGRLRSAGVFTGKAGTHAFIRFGVAEDTNLLVAGLGTRKAEDGVTESEKLRSLGGSIWARLKTERCRTARLDVSDWTPFEVGALLEGLVLAAYSFDKYRAQKKGESEFTGVERIEIEGASGTSRSKIQTEVDRVLAMGEAVSVTRDWSNEPSNEGTPDYYATEAQKLSKKYGLHCRVLTESDAKREKMGLYLGVGQGAEREGRIVVVEYKPTSKQSSATKTLVLVGKGITFDSGGISIKPALRMEDMKHDMTGAATVMGAMILAAKWGSPHRVVGVMAFTENMPSGNAIQPGNVLTARNGKTVEIINTDAEGRLILADALDFAQDYKPDAIVDIATLTGAVSIALGKYCCAILGNDESLIEEVRRAGEAGGERIWQLPLFDDYLDDMKSDIADLKNSANDGYGGTIRGAIFLKQFIRKDVRWAHLDIASTANGVTHLSYIPKKGASGLYVRTLARWLCEA